MEVTHHPLVKQDVVTALKYYSEISPGLAAEFELELRELIAKAKDNPLRFHPVDRGFRRANLRRFPYHIPYEVRAESVCVMLVRHNKRHPDYGMERT
ncbi:MAG TPA: type II toxin-antitoxin system RelE/ParE family toxin [Verrucomicrobiae bacterium]|nr:type II toxin-antitoxin system RelE/ParE family toxin [Verrucomicrobiae bacterium]